MRVGDRAAETLAGRFHCALSLRAAAIISERHESATPLFLSLLHKTRCGARLNALSESLYSKYTIGHSVQRNAVSNYCLVLRISFVKSVNDCVSNCFCKARHENKYSQ